MVGTIPVLAAKEKSTTHDVTPRQAAFCTRIQNNASALQGEMFQKIKNFLEKHSERTLRVQSDRLERDAERSKRQNAWSTAYDKHFSKLRERAGTDAEIQAVEAFQITVTAALETRRKALEIIIERLRVGTDEAMAVRQAQLEDALNRMQASVDTALSRVRIECVQSGIDPMTLRTELVTALRSAREEFTRSAKQSNDAVAAQLRSFSQGKRNEAIAAEQVMRLTLEEARRSLKRAFGE